MVVASHMQTQYECVWELAFYGKLQQVIFIQLIMEWYFIFEEGVHET